MIFEILFKIKIVLVLKNGGKTTENQKYCYRDTGKKNCIANGNFISKNWNNFFPVKHNDK